MARFDSTDLLARFKRLVKRPSTDGSISDEEIYTYLSDAQEHVMRQLAVHVPAANRAAKEKLTTSDGGLTYELSSEPIGRVDIYPNPRATYKLSPGEAWNHSADFEWDGLTTIRMIANTERTFADGPYAHYVPVPDEISASSQPTLVPSFARVLIPVQAAIIYANEGGLEDPTPYEAIYEKYWTGDKPGDIGVLGELRLRYGTADRAMRPWWRSPDLSDLPIGLNS